MEQCPFCRSVLTLSHSCDNSWDALQKLPWKVIRESWRPERTGTRKSRTRRHWKIETRLGTQPDGSNHLGPGLLHPHLLLDENGAQTKRWSVLIDNDQQIGKAQIKRARFRHGSYTVQGNEVIFTDPHKDIHGDENNDCLWPEYIFSPFLPLVLMLCETCETVIVPFRATRMNLLAHSLFFYPFMTVWLKANSSVHCVISFTCVVTKKGPHWNYLCYHFLADMLSDQYRIQKRKNHYSFVDYCPVSNSRHVQFTQREQNNNHEVVAERWLLYKKRILSYTRFHWVRFL